MPPIVASNFGACNHSCVNPIIILDTPRVLSYFIMFASLCIKSKFFVKISKRILDLICCKLDFRSFCSKA